MDMFARFDENQAMTLQDIKKTKRYGRTDARTDNVKTVYPPQTKFAGGIISMLIRGQKLFNIVLMTSDLQFSLVLQTHAIVLQ